MGICDCNHNENNNYNKNKKIEKIINEMSKPPKFSLKEINKQDNIVLKEGLCLLIKNCIDSREYFFCINNNYIPFFITNKNNIKEDINKIICYDNKYISLHKIKRKKTYGKYEYFFFESKENLPFSEYFNLDNIILNEQEDEIHIGENANLLDYNSNFLYPNIQIKSINKYENIFEYDCLSKKLNNFYGNLIINPKGNIIGIEIEDKCGILLKPLIIDFLRNKQNYNDINSSNNIIDKGNLNNKTKYIIPLFLAFSKIEKLKKISDASFKEMKIEENNVINIIRKFIMHYQKKDKLNSNKIINEFENIYHEENTNFKNLIDFISNNSKQKFQIDKIQTKKISPNEIQKLFFMIYEKEETCFGCGFVNNPIICNDMYLYSDKNQCKNLQSLINEWENGQKDVCLKCSNKSSSKIKIIYWPEILIIIMNDNNEIKEFDELRINKYQKEYKLICCIEHTENNNFNVFYKEQNKLYMIKADDDYFTSEEVENKINSLIKHPKVLFYEKTKFNTPNPNDLRNDIIPNNNNSIFKNVILSNEKMKNQNIIKKTNTVNISYRQQFSNNSKSLNKYPLYIPSNLKNNNIQKSNLSNHISYIHIQNNIGNNLYSPNPGYLNISESNTPLNKNILYKIPNSINTPLINSNGNNNLILGANLRNLNNPKPNTPLNTINNNNNQHSTISKNINNQLATTPLNKNNNKAKINIHDFSNNPILNTPSNGKNNYNINKTNPQNLYKHTSIAPSSLIISKSNTSFKSNQGLIYNNIDAKLNKGAYIELYNNLPLKEDKSYASKINNNNGVIYENENVEEITLFFIFKNGKELYLDVKKSLPFSEVIKQLKDKYTWLEDNINIKEYQFNGKKISEKQIVKDIGLEDESMIKIVESN